MAEERKKNQFDGATRKVMIIKSQHNGREHTEHSKTNKQKPIKIRVQSPW